MNQQKHIIHKVNVEVDVPDISTARRIHGNITDCLYSSVLPAVETALNKAIAADQYSRMDSVTIDISLDSQDELETSLPHIVSSDINTQLSELFSKKYKFRGEDGNSEISQINKGLEHTSVAQKRWEIFIYFLSTGKLAWYAGSENWLEEEMLLDEVKAYHQPSIQKALSQPMARQRLLRQFSQGFVLQLIEKVFTLPVSRYLENLKELSLGNDLKKSEVFEKEFILQTLTRIAEDKAEPLTEADIQIFFNSVTTWLSDVTGKTGDRQKDRIT
jgi:hypothetical protein